VKKKLPRILDPALEFKNTSNTCGGAHGDSGFQYHGHAVSLLGGACFQPRASAIVRNSSAALPINTPWPAHSSISTSFQLSPMAMVSLRSTPAGPRVSREPKPSRLPAATGPEWRCRAPDTRLDAFAGGGPFAGLERLLGLAHRAHASADHSLNGVVAVHQRIFQRLDHLDCIAVCLDHKLMRPFA